MSKIKVQKSVWVIVANPDAIDSPDTEVIYYRDAFTYGESPTTKSFISAWWFDDQRDAEHVLQRALGTSKLLRDTLATAKSHRLIIGIQ